MAARPRLNLVVTGFGPFAGVRDNPSSALVTALVERYGLRNKNIAENGRGGNAEGGGANGSTPARRWRLLSATTLRVASHDAAEAVQGLLEEALLAAAATTHDFDIDGSDRRYPPVLLLLHLGVNTRATGFCLENFAYNEADFGYAKLLRFLTLWVVGPNYIHSRLRKHSHGPST